MFSLVQAIGGLEVIVLLVIGPGLEDLVCDAVGLVFEDLARIGVVGKDMVLMLVDTVSVSTPSVIVHLTLPLLMVVLVHPVPIHHILVLLSSRLDIVRKLRVLLSNTNLFL